ncbi:hypothetical protein JCM10207_005559 [Rhodosporidiobolus poonsookiae]
MSRQSSAGTPEPPAAPQAPLALLARARQLLSECVTTAQADDAGSAAEGGRTSTRLLKSCVACRALKVRCLGKPGETCSKCAHKGIECEYPEGRKMGRKVTSQRTKKLYQLQDDLDKLDSLLRRRAFEYFETTSSPVPASTDDHHSDPEQSFQSPSDHQMVISTDNNVSEDDETDGNIWQLLSNPSTLLARSVSNQVDDAGGDSDCSVFDHELDIDPTLDPVHLGLITEAEFERSLAFYFSSMHRYMSLLDPALHTSHFIRRASPFLATVVALITTTYDPLTCHRCSGLRAHALHLSTRIFAMGFKSVEVILAFCLWAPWSAQFGRPSLERQWMHASLAVRMAAEIRLQQPLPPQVIEQYRKIAYPFPLAVDLLEASRKRVEEIVFCIDLASSSLTGRIQTLMSVYSPNGNGGEQSAEDDPPLGDTPSVARAHAADLSLGHYFAKALSLHAGLRSRDLQDASDLRDAFNQSWKADLASWDERWADVKELPYLSRLNRHLMLLSYSLVLDGGPVQPIFQEAYQVALHTASYICEDLGFLPSLLYASNFVITNIGYPASFLLRCSTRFGANHVPTEVSRLVRGVVSVLDSIGSTRLFGHSIATDYAHKLAARLVALEATPPARAPVVSAPANVAPPFLASLQPAPPAAAEAAAAEAAAAEGPPAEGIAHAVRVPPRALAAVDSHARASVDQLDVDVVEGADAHTADRRGAGRSPALEDERTPAPGAGAETAPWDDWPTGLATDPRIVDQLFSWLPVGGEGWVAGHEGDAWSGGDWAW